MLAVFSTMALLAPMQDVARAERLYDQARYDEALESLGPSCDEATSVAECERIRAFTFAALGRDDDARGAFARLLQADSAFELSADVSPRLRQLFGESRDSQGQLTDLTVAAIDVLSARGPWIVRVKPSAGKEIGEIVVYIAPSGSDAFQPVTLAPEGDSWVGTFRPASGETGTARYFIETKLASGAIVVSGSSAVPHNIPANVGAGAGGEQGEPPGAAVTEAAGGPGFMARMSTKTGIPEWGLWSIGGGAVAVVVGGIALTYILLRDPEPGAINFQVRYE
jgi:hypothetical protein